MTGEKTERAIFTVQDVRKSFVWGAKGGAKETVALQDINLEVGAGEFVCLLGPSGCGKTTLLQMMAGLAKPSGGRIAFEDRPVQGPDPDRCYVFQRFVLFPWLTALGNVEFGLRFQKHDAAERRTLALAKMRLVGLEKFVDHYPFELSGGMQQRIALARALVIAPRALLMDEPFGSLDAQTRSQMQRELIRLWTAELHSEVTIVFVTHDIGESLLLADRVVLMTARPGTVKAIYDVDLPRPRDPFDPKFVELEKAIFKELEDEIARTRLQDA
ncbi:MAG: ABC transporter ATP-binding protein [Candidatus Eremiobacteraeota bacterium]|nr:ABC transporter ATP-binding protein [Candidatus Eremiobacteraeota bacterium]